MVIERQLETNGQCIATVTQETAYQHPHHPHTHTRSFFKCLFSIEGHYDHLK